MDQKHHHCLSTALLFSRSMLDEFHKSSQFFMFWGGFVIVFFTAIENIIIQITDTQVHLPVI